jgi:hypothetical protein
MRRREFEYEGVASPAEAAEALSTPDHEFVPGFQDAANRWRRPVLAMSCREV